MATTKTVAKAVPAPLKEGDEVAIKGTVHSVVDHPQGTMIYVQVDDIVMAVGEKYVQKV